MIDFEWPFSNITGYYVFKDSKGTHWSIPIYIYDMDREIYMYSHVWGLISLKYINKPIWVLLGP